MGGGISYEVGVGEQGSWECGGERVVLWRDKAELSSKTQIPYFIKGSAALTP